jgi:uncharacterized protein (DUF924 family)
MLPAPGTETRDMKWAEEILQFWFGELTPEDWYTGKAESDAATRERFLPLYRELSVALPDEAWTDPDAALAAIILFDQFPRNMFRGQAEAFGSDDLASALARNTLDRGFDQGIGAERKQFLYMPLMHSEVLADQERCVSLFKALGNEEGLKYAIEHRDIIARFGRFPHRNRVLGRESTPDERAFLESHAGYGQ